MTVITGLNESTRKALHNDSRWCWHERNCVLCRTQGALYGCETGRHIWNDMFLTTSLYHAKKRRSLFMRHANGCPRCSGGGWCETGTRLYDDALAIKSAYLKACAESRPPQAGLAKLELPVRRTSVPSWHGRGSEAPPKEDPNVRSRPYCFSRFSKHVRATTHSCLECPWCPECQRADPQLAIQPWEEV